MSRNLKRSFFQAVPGALPALVGVPPLRGMLPGQAMPLRLSGGLKLVKFRLRARPSAQSTAEDRVLRHLESEASRCQ